MIFFVIFWGAYEDFFNLRTPRFEYLVCIAAYPISDGEKGFLTSLGLPSPSWSISQDICISRIIIFRMKLNSQISIDNFKNQYMPLSVMSSCPTQVWILPGEQHSGKVYFHSHCLHLQHIELVIFKYFSYLLELSKVNLGTAASSFTERPLVCAWTIFSVVSTLF